MFYIAGSLNASAACSELLMDSSFYLLIDWLFYTSLWKMSLRKMFNLRFLF